MILSRVTPIKVSLIWGSSRILRSLRTGNVCACSPSPLVYGAQMLCNNLCAPSWVRLCSSPVGRPSTSYPASRSRERCWRTSRESSRLSVGPGEKGHMMKTRWLWYFLYTRKPCPKSVHIFKGFHKAGIHFRVSS